MRKSKMLTHRLMFLFFVFCFVIYLFIWLCWVLVAAGGLLSSGMRTLSCSMRVGSSSLTRDWTQAPCIGSAESYPLRHQGGPPGCLFFKFFYYYFFIFWLLWVFIAAHGLSLVVASGGYSSLRCAGFSLRWLLLLRSTGSRRAGFSSCGTWAQ